MELADTSEHNLQKNEAPKNSNRSKNFQSCMEYEYESPILIEISHFAIGFQSFYDKRI